MQKIKAHDQKKSKEPKAQPSVLDEEEAAQRAPVFKRYDLDYLCIPIDARPLIGQEYRGAHSYTVLLAREAASWRTSPLSQAVGYVRSHS